MIAFAAVFPLVLAVAAPGAVASDKPPVLDPGASPHFAVTAEFHPGKAADAGEVAVTFAPRDPDVRINSAPAPRLRLDEAQRVLAERPAPKRTPAPDEKYLDTTFPVVFPVAVLGSARAARTVKGSVTYYYCSHREHWCRKGTADLEIRLQPR